MKDLEVIMSKDPILFRRYYRVLSNQDKILSGGSLLGVSLKEINQRVELIETEIRGLCGEDQEIFNHIQNWTKEQVQYLHRKVEERLEKEGEGS